ncbi:MAG: hypothetical protein HGA33_00535 [Candidatus Moranbacteria bacterium]|nr:hypothetical protein [Candidatus Moranbacteria bacterium]
MLFLFAYGIGSVIFIGRMLYGKKQYQSAAETWHIHRFGGRGSYGKIIQGVHNRERLR